MRRRSTAVVIFATVVILYITLRPSVNSWDISQFYKYSFAKIVEKRAEYLNKTERKKFKLLILTYMRSGSTFLGSMFKENREIFYVFEPLQAVSTNKVLHYINSTERPVNAKSKEQVLDNVFKCKFQSLSVENLQYGFWWYSTQGKPYGECTNKTLQQIPKCLPKLTEPCLKRTGTAIKTIRLPMRIAETMIKKDQSLKVIHLIRDPRSTIQSRIKWHSIGRRSLDVYSKHLCKTVLDDIVTGERLARSYPNNIRLVLYEDLTMATMNVVRELYHFLQRPFTEEVISHIKKLSSKDNECFFCLARSNPTQQLTKWRRSIKFSDVSIIDKNCKEVYKRLGYLSAVSEKLLRTLTQPLRT